MNQHLNEECHPLSLNSLKLMKGQGEPLTLYYYEWRIRSGLEGKLAIILLFIPLQLPGLLNSRYLRCKD